MSKKIFIGVSWPYANGPMHIGHLAGQNIVSDVFARYHRLKGHDVLMVSGSDMHGTPVSVNAEKAGVEPKKFAQERHQEFLDIFKQLDITWDFYTTTQTENHKQTAQTFFKVLYEQGFIVKKKIKQLYDPEVKKFLADRYIEGECPHCHAKNARGNQCEEGCGRALEPTELINPKSTLSGATPILKETENFFFELPKLTNQLKDFLKDKEFWRNKHALKFAQSWLRDGLQPRSISREIDYGIPVPIDGYQNQVMYVWFEAVIGYLSAAIEWAAKQGDPKKWTKYWQNPDCEHYYFIAKDNIVFHTLIWPAQLMAYNSKFKTREKSKLNLPKELANIPLNLPYNVVTNMFLNMKGKKLSKSRGNFVTAQELLDQYSSDFIRYFFTKYAPENHDINFIWDEVPKTNNNELVANLGNFINRTMVFTQKYFNSKVPQGKLDPQVKKEIEQTFTKVDKLLADTHFSQSLGLVMKLAQFGNRYFDHKKPWENKNNNQGAATIFNCLQLVQALKLILRPYLPNSAQTIHKMLNQKDELDRANSWEFKPLLANHSINNPQILFEKVESP